MTVFRVWAPKPEKVQLKLEDRLLEMHRADAGWWQVDAPDARPGSAYAYVLDGGLPLPDPRSNYQPQGVHGPSCLVDQSAFQWTDRGFQAKPLSGAVIYELHIGTFSPEGTFEGVIPYLDHLISLGISHVELMPVAEFSGSRGWGYDGVDIYAPHHAYGGPEGLKRLVNACHEKGLAVLLDVVYNHLGPEGNYLNQYGPYFTDHHHTAWGQAINLDEAGSDEVRRFLFDNALLWLRDYHFDGLRLDAVHALIDTSAVHFLEELSAEVRTLQAGLGRHLVVIAESDLNDPRLVRPPQVGGYGLDATWSDDFHHALHAALTGERLAYYQDFGTLADLSRALTQIYVYNGRYSTFRQRRHGRPVDGLPGYRFVGYLQNHDQVGNRALGERILQLISPGLAKVGAAILLTSPFVPMIFQGEEWGAASPFQYFVDHEDPALCQAVREGRMREFAGFVTNPNLIPDPGDPTTFRASRLQWSERSQQPHAAILAWYQQLIELREREIALTNGRMDQVAAAFDAQARWFILRRGPIFTACNLADQEQEVPLDESGGELLLASESGARLTAGGLMLPAQSAAIYKSTAAGGLYP